MHILGEYTMNSTMLIIRGSSSLREALRLCAAMLGMDKLPLVVFIDEGVQFLLHSAIEDPSMLEYLQTISELVGVYVLKESLTKQSIEFDSIDTALDVTAIDISGFTDLVVECKTVATF